MTRPLTRLRDLAPRYDAILCDVWGVIRDGDALISPAIEALIRFRDEGGQVCLVSNSPRRSASLQTFLKGMGAPDGAWDAAVTSGDATHALLSRFAPGPAYKLGPDWDDPIYEGSGLNFAPLDEAAFISNTGLVDFFNETPADYEDLLIAARERDLPMVCANPDIVVQGPGGRLLYCAGALAERYEQLGGEVHYAGKPHPPIYERAYAALEALTGEKPVKARILAIGDGVPTDLTGAAREGLDCLFISAGINEAGAALPDGLQPRWQAPALVW
ncbi:MAG: TIGR01459 family HAD-type hydrolase [Oceanicaulis sp.]|uniref:TIGR01459 family HAD-type hydrolase n=1 Tax=Glycocaulis sp. TaxID=1969725 RepID=UPI0025C366AF|nr:TIGR01459 family HAD-type hydrolase [Glycocaulis sp.]MCC5981038.1 TIGR01459 family HAD-type hydrolase [Oceanicaulis sp.]MCH8522631.1 TIGR01459 family HAD-type hydrolase [Glycocaulis sp.]